MGNTAQIPTFFCIYTLEKPLHQIAEFGGFIGIIKLLYIMKRKFISALLFGALCLTPTSTFVSCSDYDDDIENLQKQITTNAATLEELANEKLSNVKVEIESLKSAQEGLEAAYKEADEETRKASIAAAQALVDEAVKNLEAALQAANERLDGQAGSIAALVAADAKLQEGIDKAEAQANHAYTLAEEARATANGNKEELAKLAESLKSIRDGLADQINVLGEDVKALTGRVGALEGALAAQEAALTEQGKKDAELEKSIADLKKEVEANKTALETLVNNKVQEVLGKIDDVKTSVSNLDAAYKAADLALQGQIQSVQNQINDTETGLAALSAKINAVEGLVNVLYSNLSNLITGVIFQESQLEFVKAQVVSNVNPSSIPGLQFAETRNGKTTVFFPYKGAAGVQTLTAGNYNVEKNGGLIYVTINPTSVNFDENAILKLENSLQNGPVTATGKITAGVPETSTGHLISRAADGNKNGLYEMRLTYNNTDETKAPAAFDNDFAVYSSYKSRDSKGQEVEKKVYSKYELKLQLTDATVQTSPQLVAVNPDANAPAGVDYRFTNQSLSGRFDLRPVADKNGKEPKVFRKYVEIIGVKDTRNNTLTGNNLTAAINEVTAMNSEALNKVWEEPAGKAQDVVNEANGFDRITMTVSDKYNGYTFTLRYFIQNYNGTIYAVTKTVLFSKPLFEEPGIAIEHTPVSSADQETPRNGKSVFFAEAKCINGCNELWRKNTAKIEVVSNEAKIKAVQFYNRATPQSIVSSATVNLFDAATNTYSTSAFAAGLNETTVGSIKDMTIVYDPAMLEVEKEYTITINSYDLNGNLVSTLPVKFMMKYPTAHADMISPNPAYFLPFNKDLKVLNGETYTAWATYDHTALDAYYDVSVGFNKPHNDTEGCSLRFDLTPASKPSYSNVGGANVPYRPVSAYPFAGTDYKFHVPTKSVLKGQEHIYDMLVGIQYFGVSSLWYEKAAQPFKLVYKSPLAYADVKFDKEVYTIGYPGRPLTINDANIWSDDPSSSSKPVSFTQDEIQYFGTGKSVIVNGTCSVELVDKQFRSLFQTIEVDGANGNGIYIKTSEAVAGGVGAITTEPITFKLVVKDFFGNTMEYPFQVKVDPNTTNN